MKEFAQCCGRKAAGPSRAAHTEEASMTRNIWLGLLASLAAVTIAVVPAAAQQPQKPNILVIMGDDVGWFNIGAYHRGSCRARRRTSTSWRPKA